MTRFFRQRVLGQQPSVRREQSTLRQQAGFLLPQPGLRLAQLLAGEDHQNAGNAPNRNIHRQPLPGLDDLVLLQVVDDAFAAAGRDIADGREHLQHPSAPVRALSGTVSAISATASPNTPPTPRPGQKAEQRKVPIRLAEEREAGEDRIDQHRDREHLRPAVAIAERTEDQAANAPADQERSR